MTYLSADSSATTATVWRTWTSTTTTTTAITAADTWGYWVQDCGTTSGATATWTTWTGDSTCGSYMITQPYQGEWQAWDRQIEQKKLTRSELKAQRKRQAEAELAVRARQVEAERVLKFANEKRQEAARRAEALLLAHLSIEQERAWREERAIFVTSQSGRRFKIKDGRAHNVFELGPDNVPIREYCVHVQPDIPNADNVLAQKLALEHNEEALLRLANSWPMVNGARRA